MAKRIIKINRITKDRQHCMDESGKQYSITEIRDINKNKDKDINVHVVRNPAKSKYPASIRYKRNCKVTGIAIKTVSEERITVKTITHNPGKSSYDIYIVLEDSGSAKNIISGIVESYAKHTGITLVAHYIFASSAGNIPKAVSSYIPTNAKAFVMYDSALNDAKTLTNIVDSMKFLHMTDKVRFISFSPRCVEECALSFNKLKDEIVGLGTAQIDLLNAVNGYLKSGVDYSSYDAYTGQYSIDGRIVPFGYASTYIKKYKKITTMEQFLADRLADITYGTAYQFVKSAYVCWYKNCRPSIGSCMLEDVVGTKRPNSPVNRCAMTLLSSDKIDEIIKGSLFGAIYDALNILLGGGVTIVNHGIASSLLRRYY